MCTSTREPRTFTWIKEIVECLYRPQRGSKFMQFFEIKPSPLDSRTLIGLRDDVCYCFSIAKNYVNQNDALLCGRNCKLIRIIRNAFIILYEIFDVDKLCNDDTCGGIITRINFWNKSIHDEITSCVESWNFHSSDWNKFAFVRIRFIPNITKIWALNVTWIPITKYRTIHKNPMARYICLYFDPRQAVGSNNPPETVTGVYCLLRNWKTPITSGRKYFYKKYQTPAYYSSDKVNIIF